MLDFAFSEAQEEYRAALRRIAQEELLPRYREGDALCRYPAEQVLVTVGITAEEVARGDFNAVLMSLGPGYTRHFLSEADPALLQRWLPGLATGEQVIGLCLTEPGAGSDMAAMVARAEPHGDGFRIQGVKNSVSFLNSWMVGAPGRAFAMISRFFDINRAVIGLKCIGQRLRDILG